MEGCYGGSGEGGWLFDSEGGMKTPDLEYTTSGIFTRFYPNTAAGEVAWREMQKDGVAAVFIPHGDMVIAQLRKAGYSVAKAKPVKETIEDILEELEG